MVPPFLPLHIEGTAARFGADDSCPWLHCSHRHTYCLLLSHQKSVGFLVAALALLQTIQTMPQLWQKIQRKQPTMLPAPAAGAKPNRCVVPLKSRLLSTDCYDGLGHLA